MSKILIVDDSRDLVDFLTILLKKQGYEIQTASTKQDLKVTLSLFTPDLILLDVRLGGEDGRELCKAIKSNYLTRDVLIILLSASPELLNDYKECLADDAIEKPFDILTLVEKIEEVIKVAARINPLQINQP